MEAGDAAVILARARQGDGDAFRVLVELHARAAFRLAYRLMRDERDAEDVVQESFIRAHRRLPDFEARSNFGTWLHRIIVNCALDALRARDGRGGNRREGPVELPETLVFDGEWGTTPFGTSGSRPRQDCSIRIAEAADQAWGWQAAG